MQFIPSHSDSVKKTMLQELGLKDVDELFIDVPENVRIKNLDLPSGLTQMEVEQKLKKLAEKNKPFPELLSFLGGGIKPHYIPPVVRAILSRSEFYTSYTPYQPEASQGFLQAMFEYQSIIAELTGMEVANCSLYDDATALAEAALMSSRLTKRKNIVIPANISWEKKLVLRNYAKGANLRITEVPFNNETGKVDVNSVSENTTDDTACVYIENPNFFGVFEEEIGEIAEVVHEKNALLVVGVDPLTLGVVKSPGSYDADIVVGEGRSLGTSMNFGGSSLGLFACRKRFIRQMPGRIIGLTYDSDGNRAFCMTLQTREQHIRREKATSNICTNEGLCALAAVVYLATLGSKGFVELGKINFEKGQLFAKKVCELPWFKKAFTGSHFNEFVACSSQDVDFLNKKLLEKGIQGGLPVGKWYPALDKCMLFGVTELHTEEDMDRFVTAVKEVYYV
ncbi:MAG TPA: aminomethyl-transferring glycine dehydrogenase subunit GcvPA [Thermoplasmatales archaeon]|nr:aminomethyl-transferring glycine dehydrogenase subunit GcvPA [Thermoplasmatales archaeon]